MVHTASSCGLIFSKLVFIFGLTFVFTVGSANAEIIIDHKQEPIWISKALESGALNQKTLDLMRRRVTCHPEECPAAWTRAINWLKNNSQSIEIMPDIANDVLTFKSAVGDLVKYPDVKIMIQMKAWTSGALASEIAIEHFDHYGDDSNGLEPAQRVQDVKIFADFKSYMLTVPGNSQ